MKLLVIGHTVEDHIHFNGENLVKPGGIYYSALSLLNFKDEDDNIFLNTSIQKENYYLFSPVYDKLDKKYFHYVDRIPKVYLNVHNFKERGETYENITAQLEVPLDNLNSFDGILINMITGFDVGVEQIKKIRESFSGIIYFDVHTLSRGLDENYNRDFRLIPNFGERASCVDILQANENELKTLFDLPDELAIVKRIFSCGVKIFILTKGEIGARIFSLHKGEIFSMFVPAIKVETKNKIGCGDVFGSVFFYTYIKSKSLTEALKLANIAGGCAVSYDELNKFENLKKDVFARYY